MGIGLSMHDYGTAQRQLDTSTSVNGKNMLVNSMNVCQTRAGARHDLNP